jgi:hypothetical protein
VVALYAPEVKMLQRGFAGENGAGELGQEKLNFPEAVPG